MNAYGPDNHVLLYHPRPLRPRHDSSTSPSGSSTLDTNSIFLSSSMNSPVYPPQPSSFIPVQTPGSSLSGSGSMSGPLVFTSTFPVTTVTQPTTTFTSFTEALVTQYPSPSTSSSSRNIPLTASAAYSTQSLIQSRTGPLCVGDGFDSTAAGIIAAVLIPSAIGLILWASRLYQFLLLLETDHLQ